MEKLVISTDEKVIDLNDISICYYDQGQGLMPVIFIHGFPFDKSSWQQQVDFLSKTQRVITYDVRGFGKSTIGNRKLSIDQFADDLINFMDYLEIKKAIVCGLSMGGYILLNAVSRFPDKFHSIILSDTQCIADTVAAKEKRQQTISHILNGGLADFTEAFIKNIFCAHTLEFKKEIVENIRNIILFTPLTTLTATLSALAERAENCSMLSKITIPTLIICGKDDLVTPPAQSEFLHSHILNSKFHIIEQAGHLSNLEQPDIYNQIINVFLSNNEK